MKNSDAVMAKMQMLVPLYGTETAAAKLGSIIQSYGAMDILQIPPHKRAEFVERVKAVT